MSADNDKHFFVNPFPVVMVALLAAGVFVGQHELQSGRPADPERARFVPTSDQDVEARLWQDPLAAVEEAAEAKKVRAGLPPPRANDGDEGKGLSRLVRIQNRIEKKIGEGERITVLAVTAFGGSYTQAAETRRRLRFAVISALGFQQYQPERPDALGYVMFELPKPPNGGGSGPSRVARDNNLLMVNIRDDSESSKTPDSININAAYEWFKRSSQVGNTGKDKQQKPSSVLLIWVNEDIIGSNPQYYFSLIFNQLKYCHMCNNDNSHLTFKLIGPSDSDAFAKMIGERITLNSRQYTWVLFDVFSPSATMSVDDLRELENLPQAITPAALAALSIVRTTDTDDKLAKALINELRLRGVTRRCEDGVILVREADTNYSARLSAHLKRKFVQRRQGVAGEFKSLPICGASTVHCPAWINN